MWQRKVRTVLALVGVTACVLALTTTDGQFRHMYVVRMKEVTRYAGRHWLGEGGDAVILGSRAARFYGVSAAGETVTAIFLIIVVLRLLDVFVIRSDEIFGEQYLTKVAGMILVFGYVWYMKGNWGSISFHKRGWGTATSASLSTGVLFGAIIMGTALLVRYGVEWLLLTAQDAPPSVRLPSRAVTHRRCNLGSMGVRVAAATLVVVAAMPLVNRLVAAWGWPEVERWGEVLGN